MGLKSTFESDLVKEKKLSLYLNKYYAKKLKNYSFKRIEDKKRQQMGIDIILTHKKNGIKYYVDEKAQLDYINESLPTFAFEISYLKNATIRKGWLFDEKKKTDFYALVTSIFTENKDVFTHCNLTFVNRKKLIFFLTSKDISPRLLEKYAAEKTNDKAQKIIIPELNPKNEGYLYHSKFNKAEQPLNLILKLDFLVAYGLAKKL